MNGFRAILLGVRFLFELALLASLAYWGFDLDAEPVVRWLAGIGSPLLAAVIWGIWIAPKADRQLTDPLRFVVETVLFSIASAALADSGLTGLGLGLILGFLLDRAALTATGGTGL